MEQMVLFWIALIFFVFILPVAGPWWLSLHDGRWLFTSLDPGTAAIVVKNGKRVEMKYKDKHGVEKTGYVTSGGSYDTVVLPFGYHLTPSTKVVGELEIAEWDEPFDWSNPYLSLLRRMGIYWIGPPPKQRAWYRFKFTEFSTETGKKNDVISREEPTNYFYIARNEYAVAVEQVEIGGNTRVDLNFSVFTNIVIPRIAIAKNVNIIIQLNSTLEGQAGSFFRTIRYERLKTKLNDEKFSANIALIDMIRILGITVDEVRLKDVSGKMADELEKAYNSQKIAELTGKAGIVSAELQGKATIITATATAGAMDIETKAIEKRRAAETKYLDATRYDAMKTTKNATIIFDNSEKPMTDEAKSMLVAIRSTLPNNVGKNSDAVPADSGSEPEAPPVTVNRPAPKPKAKNKRNKQGGGNGSTK